MDNLLIGLDPVGVPEEWISGAEVEIGKIKASASPGFYDELLNLVLTFAVSVASEVVAGWISDKLKTTKHETVKIGDRTVAVNDPQALTEAIEEARKKTE